ncbi:MAG: hypothetical protein R2800_09615 [Flavipsychrobacter sp.]
MTHKIIKTILVTCCAITSCFAQYDESRDAHIGLIYPLSTNGIRAIDYSNKMSLHAIAGVSGNEENLCLSGLASFVMQDANGLIASGFTNAVLGNSKGAQLAGFVNFTRGNITGFQGAGFTNITLQHVHGVQAAEFLNISGSVNGLQGAGFGNITTQNVNGAQLGGFMNISKTVTGFQGAGFMNISTDVKGVQIAGFMNKSKDVNSQAAGFLNIAKEVKGVQLSGFMNIADSSDYPIGLVNIIRKGDKAIGVTVDQNLTSIIGFRSGGKVLYGIVGVGSNLKNYDDPLLAIEMGLGAHLNITKHFRINTEAVFSTVSDLYDGADVSTSVRLLPALRFGAIEIFGGPTFNYFAVTNNYNNSVIDSYAWGKHEYGDFYGAQFGAIGGIQFHF